jgi:hypothetical protein
VLAVGESVACVDVNGTLVFKSIIHTHTHYESHYAVIVLEDEEIITTVDQKWYVPAVRIFRRADELKKGDYLLNAAGEYVAIIDILIVEQNKAFFDITVDECHNFFVSRSELLVHNVLPAVAVGVTLSFGAGAVEFAGATISACIAGIALGIKARRDAKQCNYDGFFIDLSLANDAQAPGKPTEKDGYTPPKNWDGKKVKHPKTGQVGYPDKKGSVWIPTGPGRLAHRGPHWDVVDSKGKHKNVLPGGKVC